MRKVLKNANRKMFRISRVPIARNVPAAFLVLTLSDNMMKISSFLMQLTIIIKHKAVIILTCTFLLALQPIVGLYFAALYRGYSPLAYEVSFSQKTTRHSR